MRDEKVIRDYRNALKKLNTQPCNCHLGQHAIQCQIGGLLMTDGVRLMTWILGEEEEMGEFVANCIHEARKIP